MPSSRTTVVLVVRGRRSAREVECRQPKPGRGGRRRATVDQGAGVAVEELLGAAGDEEEQGKGNELPAARTI
jgi:hypothetical protein